MRIACSKDGLTLDAVETLSTPAVYEEVCGCLQKQYAACLNLLEELGWGRFSFSRFLLWWVVSRGH